MKTNKKVTQVTASILATSMLGASCTAYIPHDEDIYTNAVIDTDLGVVAIPIRITIKPEDVQYLNAIDKTTQEIIVSPEKAAMFLKNPEAYLREKGYTGEVNLEETMIKFVTALSDADINNAIKDGDVKSFLQICKEKDLFVKNENNIFASSYYQEQFAKLYESGELNQAVAQLRSAGLEVNFVLPIIAVATYRIYVHSKMGLYTEYRAWTSTEYWTNGYITNSDDRYINIVDVYTLKDTQNMYVVVDMETDKMIDEVVAVAKDVFADELQSISDIELKNYLKANSLLNNY